MHKLLVVLTIFFCVHVSAQNSLANNNSNHPDSLRAACMQNSSRLLNEAFALMEKNYYLREYIDWDTLRNAAKIKLASRSDCTDAYETINWCFQQIKEKHSFIMPSLAAMEYNNDHHLLADNSISSKHVGRIEGEWLGDSAAYITIPWVSTTDENICRLIADSIQNLIAQLDTHFITKWIVDLRDNKGGNCWPMIAGAGPLLGEGICGYFIRKEDQVPISYKNGMAMQGKSIRCRTSSDGYTLKSKNNTIVILTNNSTASSGEIIAIAFKGKEQVYFYGQPTAGFTTANATYSLSDKSMLVLTVCQEADRTGKIYNGRIYPDVAIAAITEKDNLKEAALQWLHYR
ncbi:MAG: S41 family peptidase [Chitinophagaceae bacterium]